MGRMTQARPHLLHAFRPCVGADRSAPGPFMRGIEVGRHGRIPETGSTFASALPTLWYLLSSEQSKSCTRMVR